MVKYIRWITESNRLKHLLYAIPIGAIFTILCVLGVASGMEFKDKEYGNKFDWLDWLATMIGGIIGQAIQLLLIKGIA
jgi:hypothetical protein|nr:MAG TPA: putative periplasmic lipoprotein [Crassvirales sp.]